MIMKYTYQGTSVNGNGPGLFIAAQYFSLNGTQASVRPSFALVERDCSGSEREPIHDLRRHLSADLKGLCRI